MRSRIAPLLLVPMLCLVPCTARAVPEAASPAITWMTVLLNGRKVGHEEIRRERSGDIVITTQTLVMDIERNPHSRESGGAFNSEAGQSTFKLHKSNLNFPRTRE